MASAADLKRDVCGAIDAMAGDLLEISHAIHAKPELAFQEFEAVKRLTAKIEAAGLPIARGAYGLETGYVSAFGDKGAEIAILSEYDALPDIGHACGHNIIAVTGLGAALALGKLGAKLPGRVRYLGTPAEESGGGKELMAQHGAFTGVDAAMMVHPAGADLAAMPCICVAQVTAIYHGRSAHASVMPQRGINALDALVTAYQSIAQLRQHIRPTERIHGIITKGGAAPNIVPDHAEGFFYVRAPKMAGLAALKKRVEACFQAGALATGAHLELRWDAVDYLDLKANGPMTGAYRNNAEALGRTFVDIDPRAGGAAGSTDMGNVSHRVPSIHPTIACSPPDVTIHHPDFARWAASDRGDKACIDGAKALAMTALDMMTDGDLLAAAKAEFAESGDESSAAVDAAYNREGVHHTGGCACC
jgi:amidohydrolase